VITLGLAPLVALFGPAGVDAIQILNMLTVTTAVLLMLPPAATRAWHQRLSASCTAYGTCR
jgi:hypothetical protein